MLGPLLFLRLINGVHFCSEKFNFFLFADDANILYADKNLKSIELTVNIELQKLYDWLTANKLTLNAKKSNCHFSALSKKKYLDKILILQKRALRLLHSANRQDHAIPLFVNAKVLPLNFSYYEGVLSLMHDVDERNAPINILNLFSRTSNSHHYSTRSSNSQIST